MVKAIIFDFFDVIRTDAYKAWGDITGQPPEEIFDEIVISSEVGLIKPSAEIFQLMLSRLGVSPHEAVFIDDSDQNVRGAEMLGIQSILYTNVSNLKKSFARLPIRL